jgi:hypothetical protein
MTHPERRKFLPELFIAAAIVLIGAGVVHADSIAIGSASNYAVLFEGGGSNNHVNITNVTVNGNIGVGGTGLVNDSGPSIITGELDFSAANAGQFSGAPADVGPTSIVYSDAAVTTALNTVNTLNTTLGAASGMGLGINLSGTTTLSINEGFGNLFTSGGVTYRVINITGWNTTNGNTVNVQGDGSGDAVVFNFTGNTNFNNQVTLSGGLTQDQVLWNFVGGSSLSGGPTLQINDNASGSSSNLVQGIFLDPNGAVSVTNTNLLGRVFGGDSHDMQIVSGDTITAPTGVPEPSTLVSLGVGLLAIGGSLKRKLSF